MKYTLAFVQLLKREALFIRKTLSNIHSYFNLVVFVRWLA